METCELQMLQGVWSPLLCQNWVVTRAAKVDVEQSFASSKPLLPCMDVLQHFSHALSFYHLLVLCHSILDDSGNCPQGVYIQRRRQINASPSLLDWRLLKAGTKNSPLSSSSVISM